MREDSARLGRRIRREGKRSGVERGKTKPRLAHRNSGSLSGEKGESALSAAQGRENLTKGPQEKTKALG